MAMRRVYYESAVYHVMSRGNNRQAILKTSGDKVILLEIIAKYKKRYGCKIYGFVLMDNHFHLVLETNYRHNISRIMQAVLLSYSAKYRMKHNYIGYVWQGRFKSEVIDSDVYLKKCLEYIHNNPVRAQMVKRAQEYPWSSYFKYYGMKNQNFEQRIVVDRYGDSSDGNY